MDVLAEVFHTGKASSYLEYVHIFSWRQITALHLEKGSKIS